MPWSLVGKHRGEGGRGEAGHGRHGPVCKQDSLAGFGGSGGRCEVTPPTPSTNPRHCKKHTLGGGVNPKSQLPEKGLFFFFFLGGAGLWEAESGTGGGETFVPAWDPRKHLPGEGEEAVENVGASWHVRVAWEGDNGSTIRRVERWFN